MLENFNLFVQKSTKKASSFFEAVLQKVAESFGHRQSREAIRATLRGLEEAAAVTVTETSCILVAAITRRGLDHVEGRLVIDGVNRPGPGD